MNIGKSDMEHCSDVMLNIFDKLSKRFMIYEKNNDDSLSVVEYLTNLSGSIGYMAQINGSIHKTFKHEKRIKALELKIGNDFSIPMRMLEEPQLENYR